MTEDSASIVFVAGTSKHVTVRELQAMYVREFLDALPTHYAKLPGSAIYDLAEANSAAFTACLAKALRAIS